MNSPGNTIDSALDALYSKWQRRKWLMIVAFSAVAVTVLSLVRGLPSLYRSSTTILFGEDVVAESLIKVPTANELELRLGVVRQAVMSRSQLQAVIDEFDLYPEMRDVLPAESVISRLRKDIAIEQNAYSQPQWGQSSIFAITITYQGWEPELVANVANDIAARFKEENSRLKSGQTGRASEFVRGQLDQAKARFEREEARIKEYRNAHMGELPEQQQINFATLERLNAELRQNGEKQVQLINRRDALLFGQEDWQRTGATGLTGTLRLDKLKRDMLELESRYTDSFPGVIRLRNEIAELEQKIADTAVDEVEPVARARQDPAEIDSELVSLRQREDKLRTDIAALVTRIEETPRVEQELKGFAANYDASRDEYLSLQKIYQEARLAELLGTQQDEEFRVLESAIPAAYPVSPDRLRLMVVGVVLAAGFAVFVAFVAEVLDSSFHTRTELHSFTRVPVIASIGSLRTSGEKVAGTTRFMALAVTACVGVFLLGYFFHGIGENGEQLVWALSG